MLYRFFPFHLDEAVYLYAEECPLARAITARKVPRFVLRLSSDKEPWQPRSLINESASHQSIGTNSLSTTGDVFFQGETSNNNLNVTPRDKSSKKSDKKNRKSKSKSSISFEDSTPMKQQNGYEEGKKTDVSSPIQEGTDEKKKKKKPKGKARSRSFTNMINKKKKDDTTPTTELSTYTLAPGILKVFGDHISPGSNYKSVRASTISTAQEVVRQALERYGFENCEPRDYVLCDVVGHFDTSEHVKKGDETEEAKWVTEYVRVINDNEKPLVLQSLWKPANERLRRFELRRRIEVETNCFFINTADGMGRSLSENSLEGSEHSSITSGNDASNTNQSVSPVEIKETIFTPIPLSPHSKSGLISPPEDVHTNLAPLYAPYLLLIQGYKQALDNLIHKLETPKASIGPPAQDDQTCDITLHATDIHSPHCWIHRKVNIDSNSAETNVDDVNLLVTVEPVEGAEVTINGVPVLSTTTLKPDQLFGVGKHYLFIFKDPTHSGKSERRLSWFHSITQKTEITSVSSSPPEQETSTNEPPQPIVESKPVPVMEDKSVQVELITSKDKAHDSSDASDLSSDEEDAEATIKKSPTTFAPRKQVTKSQLQFSYEYSDEEEVLQKIIEIAEDHTGFKLTPAYLFVMMIEHSASAFTEIQTRKLLLKISSGLQGIAWVSEIKIFGFNMNYFVYSPNSIQSPLLNRDII